MGTTRTRLRLGTRASALARWQADWTKGRLEALHVDVEIVLISTEGDELSNPIGEIGGQGLFTKRIQQALLENRIDVAVHSLKDLPTEPVDGLMLGAVPPRESPGDVLVSNNVSDIASLPTGARIGTGSQRRKAQLLHIRPDLTVDDIRGNVDTRLRKLDDGDVDAIILAEAGLRRLGLVERITQIIPRHVMLPAVGQGALGIEIRTADIDNREIVQQLDHAATRQSVTAERQLLSALRAGCLAPVGAWARVHGEILELDAVVLSNDGKHRISASAKGDRNDAAQIGQGVADDLLARGAAELIAQSRNV